MPTPKTEKKTGKKEDDFISAATRHKELIIKHSDEQRFVNELGALGYEDLDSVMPEHQEKILTALVSVLKELTGNKDGKLDL